MISLSYFMICSCLLMGSPLMAVEVGDKAPDITAVNHLNKNYSFKDHYQKGFLLVFFYPRANTPGCTAQNKSLRDSFSVLNAKNISIVGVSTDSVSKQQEFHSSLKLPFDLISDEDEHVAKAFGVPVRLGFASRQAFLLKDGKVVWVDHDASTEKQAEDVLDAVDRLAKPTVQ